MDQYGNHILTGDTQETNVLLQQLLQDNEMEVPLDKLKLPSRTNEKYFLIQFLAPGEIIYLKIYLAANPPPQLNLVVGIKFKAGPESKAIFNGKSANRYSIPSTPVTPSNIPKLLYEPM